MLNSLPRAAAVHDLLSDEAGVFQGFNAFKAIVRQRRVMICKMREE